MIFSYHLIGNKQNIKPPINIAIKIKISPSLVDIKYSLNIIADISNESTVSGRGAAANSDAIAPTKAQNAMFSMDNERALQQDHLRSCSRRKICGVPQTKEASDLVH